MQSLSRSDGRRKGKMIKGKRGRGRTKGMVKNRRRGRGWIIRRKGEKDER